MSRASHMTRSLAALQNEPLITVCATRRGARKCTTKHFSECADIDTNANRRSQCRRKCACVSLLVATFTVLMSVLMLLSARRMKGLSNPAAELAYTNNTAKSNVSAGRRFREGSAGNKSQGRQRRPDREGPESGRGRPRGRAEEEGRANRSSNGSRGSASSGRGQETGSGRGVRQNTSRRKDEESGSSAGSKSKRFVDFPMSFESDPLGSCPKDWTCSGETLVCHMPGISEMCRHPGVSGVHGSRYLTVGNDFSQGNATSVAFYLPREAAEMELKRSGGADAGSGFYVLRAADNEVLCAAEGGLDTNSFSAESCRIGKEYGGEIVYISIRDTQSSEWGKVLVDDIRLKSAGGTDILQVEVALEGTTTTTTQTWQWIHPPDSPEDPKEQNFLSIVTYAGKDKQPYIDGAIVLGRSLQRNAPSLHRYCMVNEWMSDVYQRLLRDAGWRLIPLQDWHPNRDHFARNYWWDVYNKINLFRLRLPRPILYMDADMLVLRTGLENLLANTTVEPGHIAMVKDEQRGQYNAGFMLLNPDLEMFAKLHDDMVKTHGWQGLDQPLINREFHGRIVMLDKVFNAHGSTQVCEKAVVAHYTGHDKPSLASRKNLLRMKHGYDRGLPYLQCPQLYTEYLCELRVYMKYLSERLQWELNGTGSRNGCLN